MILKYGSHAHAKNNINICVTGECVRCEQPGAVTSSIISFLRGTSRPMPIYHRR